MRKGLDNLRQKCANIMQMNDAKISDCDNIDFHIP